MVLKDLLESQNGRCVYTGRKISIGVDAWLDHKVPRNQGGGFEIENLQWVHRDANRMKTDLLEPQFFQMVKEIYEKLSLGSR
jgi:5-methylcytosine-specific restriction endonuclease McrA